MALFEKMTAHIEKRARSLAERALRAAEATLAEFPDIMLHREGEELVISGRGLMRRWLSDARLRFVFWRRS